MKISRSFASRGCNEKPDSFVVSYQNDNSTPYCVYSSGKDVIVADLKKNEIDAILKKHNAYVNCVALIPNQSKSYYDSHFLQQNEFVSCDCDGNMLFWRRDNGIWSLYQTIQGSSLIETVTVQSVSERECIVLTTTEERGVSILYRPDPDTEWSEIIHFVSPSENVYYTSLHCCSLLHDASDTPFIVLFLAGTDHYLYVHQLDTINRRCDVIAKLSGWNNWISCMSMHYHIEKNRVLFWHLLVGSQDGNCRIWKIEKQKREETASEYHTHNYHQYRKENLVLSFSLESIVSVSSSIVYSVQAHPFMKTPQGYYQPFYFLIASMDAFIKVYSPEDMVTEKGVFSPLLTLSPHLIGSQGFYGAFWMVYHHDSEVERSIYAYGYHGSMFAYKDHVPSVPFVVPPVDDNWITPWITLSPFFLQPFLSGHHMATKCHFSRYGSFIVSSGQDRTVRIWGRERDSSHWQEVGRPVVHGYAINDAVCIKDHTDEGNACGYDNSEIGCIVTINDEKKCRIYQTTWLNLLIQNTLLETKRAPSQSCQSIANLNNTYYWSSYSPELGLGNKGIPLDQADNTLKKYQLDIDGHKNAYSVESKPTEDEKEEEEDAMLLMTSNGGELEMLVSLDVLQSVSNVGNNTLNESRLCKGLLYNEINYLYNNYTTNSFISIVYDPVLDYLVTTTSGEDEESSKLTVWDNTESENTGHILQKQYLLGHRSTVVECCFASSQDGTRYMISVGKDRSIRIWKNTSSGFLAAAVEQKAHSRIMWSCCSLFSSSIVVADEEWILFATASRDKSVKIWKYSVSSASIQIMHTITYDSAATAIAASCQSYELENQLHSIITVGFENGELHCVDFGVQKDLTTFTITEVEKEDDVDMTGRVTSIEWLPLLRSEMEEYFSQPNCVVGNEDGGVYLLSIHT